MRLPLLFLPLLFTTPLLFQPLLFATPRLFLKPLLFAALPFQLGPALVLFLPDQFRNGIRHFLQIFNRQISRLFFHGIEEIKDTQLFVTGISRHCRKTSYGLIDTPCTRKHFYRVSFRRYFA